MRIELSNEFYAGELNSGEYILAQADEVRGTWFGDSVCWGCDGVPSPTVVIETTSTPEGLMLTLTAQTVLKDLLLDPSRWSTSGSVDCNLLTLLPNETIQIVCRGVDHLSAELLQSRGGCSAEGHVLRPRNMSAGSITLSV